MYVSKYRANKGIVVVVVVNELEGHLGVVGTKQNLRTKVWWPGMEKAAEGHCRACHGCQLVARPDPGP